jgi:hypothetical protein
MPAVVGPRIRAFIEWTFLLTALLVLAIFFAASRKPSMRAPQCAGLSCNDADDCGRLCQCVRPDRTKLGICKPK